MNIVMTGINEIKPYAKNPRKNDRAVATVANSIEQYGFQQPIVVDRDHVIIVGHTRYRAAHKLNLTQVPVVIAHTLTDEQVRAYRLMDNRSNENAQWDNTLLMEELQEMLDGITIQDVSYQSGFSESELNKLFSDDHDLLDQVRDVLTPETYSRTDDVWILGRHRIVNGDSTQSHTLAALLGTEKIDLVWEDAPYGVAYQTPNSMNHSQDYNKLNNHKIANDTLTGEQLDTFLDAHLAVVMPYVRPGASLYWCHDIRYNHQFKQVLENNSVHTADTLIWRKDKHSTWLTDYAKYYEPIIYGWKTGAEHRWFGHKMQPNAFTLDELEKKTPAQLIRIIQDFDTNYQEFKKEPRKTASLHPTVKPVKLIEYHMINSSEPGDLVYDGFSGSGSTLMAAEISGRCARCVELEPKFVDVTIRRWQELTGLQAVRESDGVLWDDLESPESFDRDQAMHDNMTELFSLPVGT
jgi:site-specific DNA-methyltransferase (adenine-specific)